MEAKKMEKIEEEQEKEESAESYSYRRGYDIENIKTEYPLT